MALARDIGESDVSVKCIKPGGKVYELVTTGGITISRSQNAPSKLSCKVLRDEITVEKADTIDFTLDHDHHQFFGIVVDTQKEDEWCSITAYDQLYYLTKNKKRINYEDVTLKELLIRICSDRGYNYTEEGIEETLYKLPARSEQNTLENAIIQNGIDETYNAVKTKYFLWDDAGFIRLNSTNWLAGEPQLIVDPAYFESYSYTESMDEGYSVVRAERALTPQVETTDQNKDQNNSENKDQSTEGDKQDQQGQPQAIDEEGSKDKPDSEKTEEEKQKEKLEKQFKTNTELETVIVRNDAYNTQYGTIEDVVDVPATENIQEYAQKILDQDVEKFDKPKLTINRCQGDITVRGGTPLLVDFYSEARKEYIRGWFEVNTVTHTIENGWHTMDLDLTLIKSLDEWDNTDPSYYSHYVFNQ